MNKAIKKELPNILTTLRLLVVPFFWWHFLRGNAILSTVLFSSACITDALDGFLARRWHVESRYGKIIDPIADKLLVLSSLILYGIKYNLLMILPIILESSIALVNIKKYLNNIDKNKIKNLKLSDKIKYVFNNGKHEVKEIGRKKTIILMLTAALSIFNTNFNHLLDSLLNVLIGITATLEGATLYSYAKKDTTDLKEEDKVKKSDTKEELYDNPKTNRKEMYEKLKKELDFLVNKQQNTKNKVLLFTVE